MAKFENGTHYGQREYWAGPWLEADRGIMEPVFVWNTKGRGRCFNSILGHDVIAMENKEWTKLILRRTEWAATGRILN